MSEMQELASRLDRIERSSRRWKGVAGLALASCALLVFTGQAGGAGNKVECDSFVLKDKAGKVRISMGLSGKSGDLPYIRLYGPDQEGSEPGARAVFHIMETGTGGIFLHGSDNKAKAVVECAEPKAGESYGQIYIVEKDGKTHTLK
jgi:hypothetical protein